MTLQEEAEKYEKEAYRELIAEKDNGDFGLDSIDGWDIQKSVIDAFQKGANSNYVKRQIIEAKIEVLNKLNSNMLVVRNI